VSFLGGSGSLHDPVFGVQIRFGDLSAGTHTFELRNVSGVAYVDRFCVERAYPTGMPQTGPGETTSVLQAIAPLGVLLQSVDVLAGAQSISAVASGSGLLRLVLLDPAGSVLATADSVGGVAVLEASVSATGLYQVQVLNLGTSSTQAWMAATPFGSW
jgi:hypothetical protein